MRSSKEPFKDGLQLGVKTPERKMIIAIGAGRSGSTLLTRVLNAHPDVNFGGETDFLVPRLWGELWENRFWLHWKIQSESGAESAVSRRDGRSLLNLRASVDGDVPEALDLDSRRKVALAVEATVRSLLDIGDAPVWGYKELWNGSGSFEYDWEIYDSVFPTARWVHLIRNPFSFVKSCSRWVQRSLDEAFLAHQLTEWVSVVEYSRLRAKTGNYHDVRYEDLIRSPENALLPVLEACGLLWVPECRAPLQTRVMGSSPREPVGDGAALTLQIVESLFEQIPGLWELCDSFGYLPEAEIPNYFTSFPEPGVSIAWTRPEMNRRLRREEGPGMGDSLTAEAEVGNGTESMKEHSLAAAPSRREIEMQRCVAAYAKSGVKGLKRTRLKRVFRREAGLCWIAALPELVGSADSERAPLRSNLLLYENDILLEGAHSLHDEIRLLGGGRYSHWNEALYFSTSDGSDPNKNGRHYRVVYVVEE